MLFGLQTRIVATASTGCVKHWSWSATYGFFKSTLADQGELLVQRVYLPQDGITAPQLQISPVSRRHLE